MTYSQLYTQIIKPFFMEKGAGDFMPFYTQDWDKFLFETINTANGKPFIGYCVHVNTLSGLNPSNKQYTYIVHTLSIDVLFPLGVKDHDVRLNNWDNAERLLNDFINYIYNIDKIKHDDSFIYFKIDGMPFINTLCGTLPTGDSEINPRSLEPKKKRNDCTGASLNIEIKIEGNLKCQTPILFDLEKVKQVMAKTSTTSNSKTSENALNRFRK